jgi:hypothetical protein
LVAQAASEGQKSNANTVADENMGAVNTVEDKTRVLKRKQFASLMVRLLTAVQQGSLVCFYPECSLERVLNVP